MFSEIERNSTAERVDTTLGNDNKSTSLFLETMGNGASSLVSRTAFNVPQGFPDTMPPALNDTPTWLNPTPPALNDIPSWQNQVQPGVDDRPKWQRKVSDGQSSTIFNPAPPAVDQGKPWRAGWGETAPGFPGQVPTPAPDSGKPWRAGWGDVAPGFPGQLPTPAPDNGRQWKQNWGDVAPGFPGQAPAAPVDSNSPWKNSWGSSPPTGFQVPQAPDAQVGRASIDTTGSAGNLGPFGSHPSPWGSSSDVQLSSQPVSTADNNPGPISGFPFNPPAAPARTSDNSGNIFTAGAGKLQSPGDFFPGFPGGHNDGGTAKAPVDSGNQVPSGDLNKAAANALQQDLATRSEYSFENGVSLFKNLGKQNEVAPELQLRDWMSKQNTTNPITYLRGTALLADGLGEFRLDNGSRIDPASRRDTKAPILAGYNYDFGGEATNYLRFAASSLIQAQNYAIGHKGLTVDGQSMDDNYIHQLQTLQTNVESKLNVIYGAHDVNAAFGEIRNQVRVNSGDWQQGLVRLQHSLDALHSGDKRYIAKEARDVALGYYAEADYMASQNNGEDSKIMYQYANKYLNIAMQDDGVAPDNVALQQIATKLGPAINQAIDNQYSDPFGNPFNIPKPPDAWV